ncbi:hypothetical protein KP509_29G029300 [Ceratopteris richardii]|uniref:Uncharacterized protein n=1 Tax=Ceratopteris richardii TaxID=49495 RepID=A0A8T2R6R0_CERRI|nr:hypothetical protein KP509_29G029300 [Ceratopteris richardii]KAH7291701.1 hypothetical protein KP509_29G029300 [Ceratopteris richardii]
MFRVSFLFLCFLLLVTTTLALTTNFDIDFASRSSSGKCNGSLGQCDLDSEFLLDSEVSRRILAGTSGYISYGALSANRVPCSTAGRSYYNCRGSGAINPYTRGCGRITKCARDTS